VGRYNHFFKNASYAPGVNATANGSIYFTPSSGTYEVHGPVRDKWASLGYEASCLGYPTSDVLITSTGQESNFNGGTVIYNNASAQTVSNCNAPGTNQDYMPPGATINPQCTNPSQNVSATGGAQLRADLRPRKRTQHLRSPPLQAASATHPVVTISTITSKSTSNRAMVHGVTDRPHWGSSRIR